MPDILETSDAAASTATTYSLGIGMIVNGKLTAGTDAHDWYRVNLTAGQTYSFAMTGIGTNNVTDTYLRLYNSTGTTLLAQDDDSLPNQNSIFTYTPTQSGTYYVDAGSYGDLGSGTYGLTVAAGSRPSFDIVMGAGVIDTDYSWSAPGAAATVTYGFRQSPATYTVPGSNISTFSQVTAAEIVAIQTVLQFCADVCRVTFTQVNPGGYTNNATILYGNYTAYDGAGAFAFYPGSTASTSPAGDVWINTTSVSTTSLPFGSYSFEAILHETMHTIGLSHPGLYDAMDGGPITYENSAQFAQDSNQFSAMSYFDESNTGGSFLGYPATPMLFDIYALQQIYGANTTTRIGDTVYGFGSNAGAVFDLGAGGSRGFCIWDAGGIDTIDASGYSTNQLIDLNAGACSNLGSLIANVSIALGALIENAIGGSGNDTLVGNSANNRLNGGLGTDKAIFAGHHGNYTVNFDSGGNAYVVADQRSGTPDGTDTLISIESLQFSDGNFALNPTGGLTFTISDTDASRPWSTIVTVFDNFGSIASETVNNDNGTRDVSIFDTADAGAWAWTTNAYNPAGNLVSQSGTNDNGSHWLTFYDVPNDYAFAVATLNFDAGWMITGLSGTRDDGAPITSMDDITAAYDTLSWFPEPYDANLNSAPVDSIIFGGGREDILYGHAGNDTIDGAGGDDILSGGFGDDIFVFHPGEADGDVILDFNAHDEADLLEFIGYGAGATLTQVDPSHIRIDYNGAASHDVIVLANGPTIHPSDYFFV